MNIKGHLAAFFKDTWRGVREPRVWLFTAVFALTVLLGYLLATAHSVGAIIVGAVGYCAAAVALYLTTRRLTR